MLQLGSRLGVVLPAASFINGVLLTFAFSPFHYIWTVLLSFLFLIYLIQHIAAKGLWYRFAIGYCYGLGHFITSLYWISYALLFEPDRFAWLIPFCVVLIPAIISVFIGFFVVLVAYFIRSGSSRWLVCLMFACGWVLTEFCRSHAILAFPWNLLGYTAFFSIYFVQIASIIGVYGLSFLIAFAAVVFYSRKWLLIISVYSCIALCFFYGYFKIDASRYEEDNGQSSSKQLVKLRIIQPNFQEFHFGQEKKKIEYLLKLIAMSNQDGYQNRDLIIWPESAYPFVIQENDTMLQALINELKSDASLVFGVDRYFNHYGVEKLFNSILSLDKKKGVIDFYDKKILVPFGEYIPLRRFLPFLNQVVGGNLEFSRGQELRQLKINRVGEVIPLICFEIIFDSLYNNKLVKNALFALNITNDLWFYDSVGPYQHFAASRMRAIEYGLPLVRVANTGISAVVDCYGRVIVLCRLNTEAVADYDLKINKIFSVYIQYRLKFIILEIIALTVVLSIFSVIRKRKNI